MKSFPKLNIKLLHIPVLKRLIIFSALAFNAFSASSQDSLMNYLEIAAKNNPVVLQKFYEYQTSLQKVPQAASLPDPQLNTGVFFRPMELLGGKQVAEFQLMQMFPWFGVLKNGKDEMSLMSQAKYESFRDSKLQVFYDVQRTWYDLHKNEQNIRISAKNVEILKTLERLALVKYKSVTTGSVSSPSSATPVANSSPVSSGGSSMNSMGNGGSNNPSTASQSTSSMQSNSMAGNSSGGSGLADLYRIQIEIADLENSIALLKSQENTTKARFNAFLNRPPATQVLLPDTLIADTLYLFVAGASDSILAKNPMLSMLQLEQQSIDARKKMVTRMGYPMVGLGLNYTLIKKNEMSESDMNGKDMIMPMVTVTIPIYRKKYRAMRSEADMNKLATTQNYSATANQLLTEYYEAIQLHDDAHRRMKLYENQKMLAQKSLNIMIASFSASTNGLNDILAIRQQTWNYELKYIEALIDYNVSIAWLKRLMASN